MNNGGFQIYESSGQDGIAAGAGNFYISFGHSGSTGGTLSQIFDTVIGTTYRVEYLIRQQQGDDPGQSLMVGIAGGPSVSNTGLDALAWVAGNVLTFTASAATSQLVFTDTTTGGGGGANIALDGVTVTAVPTVSGVPEPATWAMMVLGFGIIGRAMRKGRRQAFA